MNDQDKLALIVVSYGSLELLQANLAECDPRPIADEIVVVDNYTTEADLGATIELAEWMGWNLVTTDRNLGFGAGVNAGVTRARELGCRVFLLLNPDARIEPSAVQELYDECVARPDSMIAPRIFHADGSTWFSGATVLVNQGRTSTRSDSDSSAPGGWLSGACLIVHEQLWDTLGGFDDDYFLYWEDIDLSWRCTEAGGHLIVRNDISAVHSVGGSYQGIGKSPAYVYYNCRNRMLFATKHLSHRQVLSWMLRGPAYAWRVSMRGGRRAFVKRPAAMVGAALRGTFSGSASAVRSLLVSDWVHNYRLQGHPSGGRP